MQTGLAWDERCMWHDTGLYFGPIEHSRWIEPIENPENPQGKRRIKNLLDASGLTKNMRAIDFSVATEKEILTVHSRDYIEEVKSMSEAGGGNLAHSFGTTRMGAGGYDIARLAAGGAIGAVRAVLDSLVTNAYALVRPPGHHASNEAMGFCVFNNAALAGKIALEEYGLDRIAFVDWDVHHGNGTQSIFWQDSRVLTISIHQENCFPPDSGGIEEVGEGAGKGLTVNIPLPAGSGEPAYIAAFDRIILPALHIHRPQLIIVPCGFDAGFHDPLGRMMLTSDSFRILAKKISGVAEELCNGRLLLTHEGGYAPHTVPFHCLAVLEEISGHLTDVVDPFKRMSSQQLLLSGSQDEAISRAESLLVGIKGV